MCNGLALTLHSKHAYAYARTHAHTRMHIKHTHTHRQHRMILKKEKPEAGFGKQKIRKKLTGSRVKLRKKLDKSEGNLHINSNNGRI